MSKIDRCLARGKPDYGLIGSREGYYTDAWLEAHVEVRPNVTNNAAWARLMEGKCSIKLSRALTYLAIAGIMDMTDDEYNRMGSERALNVQGTGKHIVSISVFHQLHCVVSMLC